MKSSVANGFNEPVLLASGRSSFIHLVLDLACHDIQGIHRLASTSDSRKIRGTHSRKTLGNAVSAAECVQKDAEHTLKLCPESMGIPEASSYPPFSRGIDST